MPALPRVLALDPSLRATGIAGSHPTPWTDTIAVSTNGWQRLHDIAAAVSDHIRTPLMVVIEGPSFGSGTSGRQQGHHERAGLWWFITYRLWRAGISLAVIPPALVKRYATGRGNATKDQVLLAVARRYPSVPIGNNNEADAAVMLAMALDHLGHSIADVPDNHRVALSRIDWPEVTT